MFFLILLFLQIIAWLSLSIPIESAGPRLGMGMSTLFVITAMFASVGW
jgi:hypothetical protein